MNREEFVTKVASVMRDKEIRKPVMQQKCVFHISDDSGNSRDFAVTSPSKAVLFTRDDVRAVIDTCLQVIEETLCRGDEVNIKGFGVLGLKYREKRRTKKPGTEEWVDVHERYVPKFTFGTTLRMAARVYQMSLNDAAATAPIALEDDDGGEDDAY